MSDVRKVCADNVGALARWAAGVKFEDIPKPALERAVRVLGDDMAAMIGARDEPEVATFHRRMLKGAKSHEATIFRGGQLRTDRLSAAVANGVAADWLELDEGYRIVPCHAGLYLVPALLAEAESRSLTLRQMLRAIVLGYEIVTRVARAWKRHAPVMQGHGRYAAVGASAVIALSRDADAELLHSALTGAVTLVSAGPSDHLVSGALVRNVWPAAGAWSGMMAVDWAECGMGGVTGGFYDVYSLVLCDTAEPQRLVESLGEEWAILNGYMKMYACCQHLHSTVEAALALRKELLADASLDDVAEISLDIHPLAAPLVNPKPHNSLAAKFSAPHAVGATLVLGSGGPEAFTGVALHDPAIARLRDRVLVAPYSPLPTPPNDRPARIGIRLKNGAQYVSECLSAQGGPDRPFPASSFIEKITALTHPVYPDFVTVFEEMQLLKPSQLSASWPDIVGRICTPARG